MPVLDRGSNHRTGATVTESSRMAQSRHGSAGELLAWLPIVTGHEGLGWCVPWDNTRPLTGECSTPRASYNENSDAILESASEKKSQNNGII